jgi:hypothetical protein
VAAYDAIGQVPAAQHSFRRIRRRIYHRADRTSGRCRLARPALSRRYPQLRAERRDEGIVGTMRISASSPPWYRTRIVAADSYAANSMRTVIRGVNEPWQYGANLAHEPDGRACPDLPIITRQRTNANLNRQTSRLLPSPDTTLSTQSQHASDSQRTAHGCTARRRPPHFSPLIAR